MTRANRQDKTLSVKLSEIRAEQEEQKAKQLAEKFKLPYLNLLLTPIDVEDLSFLPEEKSRQGNLAVLRKIAKTLRLAVKDPANPKTTAILKELEGQGFECKLFIVSLKSLKRAWRKYELASEKSIPLRGVFIIQKPELEKFKKSAQTIKQFRENIEQLTTTQLLTFALAGAIEMEASDIHFEPTKQNIKLRYRIDGLLQEIAEFKQKDYRFLLSRIKSLSDMLLNVTDISQDGRLTIKIQDRKAIDQIIEIRSSVLPSAYGETVVLRLLGIGVTKLKLPELGLRPHLFKILKTEISRPNGMILTTGPTGSGKTTTLYACLAHVNKPGIKIITVEDPIEYKIEGITQTQISKKESYSYSQALKGIVRQDPDVLLIGEIRDQESVQTAIQFALTGHLVFSTLHTNNAAGSIPRLISVGARPSLIPSSLNLVIAQRLLRKLCPACKKEYQPAKELAQRIKKVLSSISSKTKLKIPKKIPVLYQAQGCKKCHHLGYQGRIGVFELFVINKVIEKLLLQKEKEITDFELQEKLAKQGMVSLMQDALLRTIEGATSLEEIARVIGPF